jgi:MFS family permease
MTGGAGAGRRPIDVAAAVAGRLARAGSNALTTTLGGRERTRVILLLASVLALASADSATVGASAIQLRHDLHISNTDIGLLVTVTSLVAAVASLPFGVLADRVRRTRLLGGAIVLWGAAMIWSATAPTFGHLLLARLFLGGVTAAAGPIVASLVGDWFASTERGRIYGYIISGELIGAAFGFAVTGGIATLSWRAAFVILALPAFALAWLVFALPEPTRGGRNPLISVTARPVAATDDDDGEEQTTDAQRIAGERGLEPDPELVLTRDPRRLGLLAAARYVLSIKTNVALILASAGGYFFLS